jgi:hypothetical protein
LEKDIEPLLSGRGLILTPSAGTLGHATKSNRRMDSSEITVALNPGAASNRARGSRIADRRLNQGITWTQYRAASRPEHSPESRKVNAPAHETAEKA